MYHGGCSFFFSRRLNIPLFHPYPPLYFYFICPSFFLALGYYRIGLSFVFYASCEKWNGAHEADGVS